jgi:hypothetical protein
MQPDLAPARVRAATMFRPAVITHRFIVSGCKRAERWNGQNGRRAEPEKWLGHRRGITEFPTA